MMDPSARVDQKVQGCSLLAFLVQSTSRIAPIHKGVAAGVPVCGLKPEPASCACERVEGATHVYGLKANEDADAAAEG